MDLELRPQIRLSDTPPDLDSLIDDWFRYGDRRTHVKVRMMAVHEDGTEEVRLSIYTDNNEYRISAKWGLGTKGYLGCVSSSRKPRAGEEHTRGSDLSDGPFTYETWFRILADIVSYELVHIAKSARPVADGVAFPSGAGYDLPRTEPNQETADVEGCKPGAQPLSSAQSRGQSSDASTPPDGSR